MNNRQFAILISITFFVGMLWLVADILFNTKPSIEISPKLQTSLDQVNPNFNPRVLKIIEDEVADTAPAINQSVAAQTSAPSFNPGTSSGSGQIKP